MQLLEVKVRMSEHLDVNAQGISAENLMIYWLRAAVEPSR